MTANASKLDMLHRPHQGQLSCILELKMHDPTDLRFWAARQDNDNYACMSI